MKVVLDMNLSARAADWLRDQGWEAVRWNEIGSPDDEDERIMDWCAEHGACLITQDGDFSDLLFQSGAAKPSLIHLRDCDPMDPATWRQLNDLLTKELANLEAGCLYIMQPQRTRMRKLPLTPQR